MQVLKKDQILIINDIIRTIREVGLQGKVMFVGSGTAKTQSNNYEEENLEIER